MGDASERVKLRRTLAGDVSAIPRQFRDKFTFGEAAALLIIHSEIQRSGVCDLPYREIGEPAGVGPSTVSKAIALAVRLELLTTLREERREAVRIIIERGRRWPTPGVNRHERHPSLSSP